MKHNIMSGIAGLAAKEHESKEYEGKEHERKEDGKDGKREKDGKDGKAKKKPKVVNLGKAGSFTIKHPGAETAAAKRAGKSVHEYAEEHKHDSGVGGARARSALGFEAMHHGKK